MATWFHQHKAAPEAMTRLPPTMQVRVVEERATTLSKVW